MMSSRLRPMPLASVTVALGLIASGCGAPPARAPVTMVRVETDPPIVVACPAPSSDEGDDEDGGAAEASKSTTPVEYVRMTEWQAPPSARQAESEIAARGPGAPVYTEFPRLQLHRPIGETTSLGGYMTGGYMTGIPAARGSVVVGGLRRSYVNNVWSAPPPR